MLVLIWTISCITIDCQYLNCVSRYTYIESENKNTKIIDCHKKAVDKNRYAVVIFLPLGHAGKGNFHSTLLILISLRNRQSRRMWLNFRKPAHVTALFVCTTLRCEKRICAENDRNQSRDTHEIYNGSGPFWNTIFCTTARTYIGERYVVRSIRTVCYIVAA